MRNKYHNTCSNSSDKQTRPMKVFPSQLNVEDSSMQQVTRPRHSQESAHVRPKPEILGNHRKSSLTMKTKLPPSPPVRLRER